MKRHTTEVKAHCIEDGCHYAWHGGTEVIRTARDHANKEKHRVTIETVQTYCYTPPKKKS